MLYQIQFSPTGGTQKAADALCLGLGTPDRVIDLCDRRQALSQWVFSPEDLCLVAVPSYGGRVPGIAMERLGRMTGGGAGAVLLCVYGNRAFEDTLLELEDLLTARGFRCQGAAAAVAEHSIVRKFAAGRPDAQDRAELADFGAQLLQAIQAGAAAPVRVPGNRDRKSVV